MKVFVSLFIAAIGLTMPVTSGKPPADADKDDLDLPKLVENSQSENPTRGLGYDWLDCLQRFQTEAEKAANKVVCHTWTAQGVTSTLFALKFGNERVPVVESQLDGAGANQRVMIDIQGGPGGLPFYSNPAMTDEFVERIRRNGMLELIGGPMEERPQYQIMKRGFTIASIGYWGMNIRTLHEPNEIELAIRDVQLAIAYYREQEGGDPPMITTSLGNHLALGALGEVRLEEVNFLSLVPVMDGLQRHIARQTDEKSAADAKGKAFGIWYTFNVYKRSGEDLVFEYSQMLPYFDFVTHFIGDHDLAWLAVAPRRPCSKIVLGSEDPRTADYLAENEDLPGYLSVWESDHDLFKDALPQSQTLFADFADCLIENEG